ncbi:MAG: 6-hydroxymethylpterin diphosphokinase MptE-like protein [Phycisphaerae bacterium]|nr:6-hydroxymethylpterin diphosphokinase MptE-like protein [Phycisphaerae bacterium]
MTSRAPNEQLLQRNLAAIAVANPGLDERIHAADVADAVFAVAANGAVVADYLGKPLASRHRPLEEAESLVGDIDLADRAVIFVVGFGLGYHVRRLGERMERAGIVAVYEPDLGLLKAVLSRIDHSSWIRASNVLFITDLEDRGEWARRFAPLDVILVQGVRIVEHPASRSRLGDAAKRCGERLAESVRAAKMSMSTTLVRSVVTANAYLDNIALYAAGAGCAELKDRAAGRLAIVVSAGPSLKKNMRLLAADGVRDRCVIIATQTTLRPLLDAGIRPHLVCALDWHHISTRFYEGIRAEEVVDTTLVLDPQANPMIARAYPGPVRVFHADFLALVLGHAARDMGTVRTGNTVAHLCYQVARWIGCDPVALIGQDLGFTDGLYYARGTAIDDVWAPELSPFNTVEMMEWQRIMRHKHHLRKTRDIHGRSMYTDSQMEGYLNRFEGLFEFDRAEGRRTIDATEGGVAKAATEVMTLAATLELFGRDDGKRLPTPTRSLDSGLLRVSAARVRELQREVRAIREASERTASIVSEMLEHQADRRRMDALWPRLERERRIVEQRMPTFDVINQFNQLGVFKRAKADRKLHFAKGLSEIDAQKAQLERDIVNVRWTADAAKELDASLDRAIARLEGREVRDADEVQAASRAEEAVREADGHDVAMRSKVRAAFVVPVDPEFGGLGGRRSLDSEFGGRGVFQRTLERLGRSREAESIVLLVPDGFEVDAIVDRRSIGLPIEVERCGASVFGPARSAIAAARLWSDSAWRGGIAGMSVYDELLAPAPTMRAMQRLELTAAVLVGPDWPCIQVDGDGGCDALVRRHREAPDRLSIVFTQSPPGLCGVLLDYGLIERLGSGAGGPGRLSTIGAHLVWQPHLPQPDPISLDVCVPLNHRVRRSVVRAIFDTPRAKMRMRRGLEPLLNDAAVPSGLDPLDALAVVDALENQIFNVVPYFGPQHVQMELCTGRYGSGAASVHRWGSIQRAPMTLRRAERIFAQLDESGDSVITLGGVGDPLHHPDFDRIIAMAKDAGIRGVHVRTELTAPAAVIDRLLASEVDVVSVDINAVTPETYRAMMGVDRFALVKENIERLALNRRHVSGPLGWDALALPWICPRLQRCVESYEDLDPFFDTWSRLLGTPVLDGPIPFEPSTERVMDPLASAQPPARVAYRELHRRMTVFSDGSIPVSELDLCGEACIGNVDGPPLLELWRALVARRRQVRRELGEDVELLRLRHP